MVLNLIALLSAFSVFQLCFAAEIDGGWKVVEYKCKSNKFIFGKKFWSGSYASFHLDVDGKQAVMSFSGGKCNIVGALDLNLKANLLRFSNYRPLSKCGLITSTSSFELLYEIENGSGDRLKLIDLEDQACEANGVSEMLLERISGS